MPRYLCAFLAALSLSLMGSMQARGQDDDISRDVFTWEHVADLPEELRVAGACAGISNGALIVAGGAHFPEPLFDGGEKVWIDDIYVLEKEGAESSSWQVGDSLDKPWAYGASITTEEGVLRIGGGDATTHYDDVFLLRWTGEEVIQEPLPSLPKPAAFLSAARVGHTVYVAGGQDTPDATSTMDNFWALDLEALQAGWTQLEPWPGPARILTVAASQDGAFFLFSGAALEVGDDGEAASRRYLDDAYRYDPGKGWTRVANMPYPAVAAPSPAIEYGPSHVFILGGDCGAYAGLPWELQDDHPGFSREILAYHTITDTWTEAGTMPFSHVTTPVVQWEGDIIVPSGEVRPGTRSPAIYRAIPTSSEGRFGAVNYTVLGVYFLVLVGMGYYFSYREDTTDDYFLAAGRVPWWAAGISIFGTQLSAITFMAIPAMAYATNWVYILGQAAIVLLAPIIVYFYLPFFRRLNVTTAYEYLERRFDVLVRLFGSTAFILLQIGRMAVVIFLPAIALSAATGMDIYLAIVLMGVLSTLYTVLGGIEAVIWSDVLQVVVLLGGAILSVLVILTQVGGFGGLVETAMAHDKFHTFTWTWDWTTTALWVVLFGNFLSNLVPYTADQTVVQRYLTTSDEKEAAQSIWTNAVLTIPAAVIFFGLGTALFVFYEANPAGLDPSLQTDAIFPLFIVQQLPVGISGLIIAGIFAAAMSSLDSSMNSVATVAVTDFFGRFRSGLTEATKVRMARWVTVGLGGVAIMAGLFLATFDIRSLFDIFLEMIGLFGGSLAGLFALGIFTRRAQARGALIGALTSAFVLYLVREYTDAHFFLYGAIGILVCFGVGYVMSLLLRSEKKDLQGLTIYSLSPRAENPRQEAHAGSRTAPAYPRKIIDQPS